MFKTFIIPLLFIAHLTAAQTVWSEEAENGLLSGTTDIGTGCANASQNQFVRLQKDAGNSLLFNNINIAKAGQYQLTISYFGVGEFGAEIFVNDVSVSAALFPSASWCYQAAAEEFVLAVNLNAGLNTLEFIPLAETNAPFFDALKIAEILPAEASVFAAPSRITVGDSSIITVSASSRVLADQAVDISVSGIEPSQYKLDKTTVTIPAGEDRASVIFKATDDGNASEQRLASIRLSNPTEGLQLGEAAQTTIHIVSDPSAFYVSSSQGDDVNDGLSMNSPWKTLEKVNSASFVPGDSILFKAGDAFIGQLVVNGSGKEGSPIVYGRYGEGDKPVIDGAKAGGGAYESAVYIHNQEYIAIRDLEITNDRRISRTGVSDQKAYGIMVYNDGFKPMNHFRFSNLTIRDIFAVDIAGIEFNKIQVAAIHFQTGANDTAGEEKNIQDVVVDSCYISRTNKLGIWSRHGGGSAGIGNDSINRNMNMVFRNNHFFETGGSGIVASRTYNCLLENNLFEYTGSDADPRMTARGSGAWFWNCRNVVAQYNTSLHVRGPADSYGMHMDFANKNILFQYNYSEDSEGGFVEILGDNSNCAWRYNISVNDGLRTNAKTIWVSDYAGESNRVKSDSIYIYNNSIYAGDNLTPDIGIVAEKADMYNNIFYAAGGATIGENVTLDIPMDSLRIVNNLYFGGIAADFKNLDSNPLIQDPRYVNAGSPEAEAYRLNSGSPAIGKGIIKDQPSFPMLGKGIFEHISPTPDADFFGNPVSSNHPLNIGSYNGEGIFITGIDDAGGITDGIILPYPNPVFGEALNLFALKDLGIVNLTLVDITGRNVLRENKHLRQGVNSINISGVKGSGIYVLQIETSKDAYERKVLICR